jgi:hypothetical protein
MHYDWMHADPKYKEQVEAIADMALDYAESKLMQSIGHGSDTATIFYLKTKGKKRGYVEKVQTEITGEDGKPIAVATTHRVVFENFKGKKKA